MDGPAAFCDGARQVYVSMSQRQPDAGESRAAVALTVAWMLTCLGTAASMLVVLAFRLLMIGFPVAAGGQHPLQAVAGVLLFVGLVTGVLCVGLTPLVYRVRRAAPPLAITIGAVLIGVAPVAIMIVLSALDRQ
jgi:hypothetical protein